MDLSSAALEAVGSGNAWAPAFAFAAGAMGSVGPCAAPRFVAVAAFTLNRTLRESVLMALSFVAGVVTVYVLFAITGSFIWEMFRHSSEIYLAGAAVMATAGLIGLIKAPARCTHPEAYCGTSAGTLFLVGASSAAILSPCCTPVVLASIAYAGTTGLWFSCAVMTCFALGHALPASLIALGGGPVRPILANPAVQGATRMIGGSLMLALAGYYAVLA